jgi:hypothetical protein
MRWERPFLVLAAANNAVWAVLVAVVPERVFATVPPWPAAFAALILAVGGLFAVNAVRRAPPFLALGLLSKALGPLVFLFAAGQGYLRPSWWPLVLLTDLVWIPPLVVLWRRRTSW